MPYSPFLAKLLIRTGIARLLPSVQRLTDGGGAFLPYYSNRLLAAPLADLRDTAAFLEIHGPDAINLALGAPSFDLVPSGSTKLPADRRGWPPGGGLPELRAAVAEKLLTQNRLPVSPADEVLVTHGAAGAFSVVLDTFVDRGSPVVVFEPASPLYLLGLRHRRARIRCIPTWLENGRLRFRLDHLDSALRRARLVVVNTPHNPTGGVIDPEDLEQIAWWADRRDVLVYSDEVLERYQYEGEPISIGGLHKARQRTLTVGSLSKGHGLAAARVGWLAGHRHLVRPCLLTQTLQTPFVPTLCQQVAVAALRQGHEAFAPVRAEFESRRRYVFERLEGMGLKPDWPAGGFCFWLPVHEVNLAGRVFAEQLLREKKVLVTPGEHFGPSGAGFVRLSYAAEEGRLREGLGRLAEFIRSIQEVAAPPPLPQADPATRMAA